LWAGLADVHPPAAARFPRSRLARTPRSSSRTEQTADRPES
jgi:hypothetical protein